MHGAKTKLVITEFTAEPHSTVETEGGYGEPKIVNGPIDCEIKRKNPIICGPVRIRAYSRYGIKLDVIDPNKYDDDINEWVQVVGIDGKYRLVTPIPKLSDGTGAKNTWQLLSGTCITITNNNRERYTHYWIVERK